MASYGGGRSLFESGLAAADDENDIYKTRLEARVNKVYFTAH